MYYKPDDGFDMQPMSDSDEETYFGYLKDARRYILLSVVFVVTTFIFLYKHRWGYAFALWILANIAASASDYCKRKAKEVASE